MHTFLKGFLHSLPILQWKWEVVIIDFIIKLPRIVRKHDSIMIAVDKLTKDAHWFQLNQIIRQLI